MIDVILSCPNGYIASLTELAENGFANIIQFDEFGSVTGINPSFNPLYPSRDDRTIPAPVYLRARTEDILPLLVEDWAETTVLAMCDSGVDIMDILKADQDALAEYLTYPMTQVPEFMEDGVTPNIQFAEFNTIDIEGVPTQVKNQHYQPCLALGNFA